MDIYGGFRSAVETFICLQRDKYMISDSVCFEYYFGRCEFFDTTFDVFDHFSMFFSGIAKL